MLQPPIQRHPRTARRNCIACGQNREMFKNVVPRDPDHVESFAERRLRRIKIQRKSEKSLGFFKHEVRR